MARRLVNQATGGGGGGASAGLILPVIDSQNVPTLRSTASIRDLRASQLNDARIIIGVIGTDTYHFCYGVGIQVNQSTGALSVGSATAYEWSGSNSYSTTVIGDVAPGVVAGAGYHYAATTSYNNTTYLMEIDTNGNISCSSSSLGPTSSGYPRPRAGDCAGVGVWDSSAASSNKKWIYASYDNSGYASIGYISGTSYSNQYVVGDSSTAIMQAFRAHHSCTGDRCAYYKGYASYLASGFTEQFCYLSSGAISRYNHGNLVGASTNWGNTLYDGTYHWEDEFGNGKYLLIYNTDPTLGDGSGLYRHIVFSPNGTKLSDTNQVLPWRPTASWSVDQNLQSTWPLAKNVFLVIDEDERLQCYELGIDGSNNVTWTKLNDNDGLDPGHCFGRSYRRDGGPEYPQIFSSGPNKEYLVACNQAAAVSYDLTQFVDLSGY